LIRNGADVTNRGPVVLVDHVAEYLAAPDGRVKQHDDRLVMIRWPLLPGLMGPVIVVVPA
jgi:hypothetical protein